MNAHTKFKNTNNKENTQKNKIKQKLVLKLCCFSLGKEKKSLTITYFLKIFLRGVHFYCMLLGMLFLWFFLNFFSFFLKITRDREITILFLIRLHLTQKIKETCFFFLNLKF